MYTKSVLLIGFSMTSDSCTSFLKRAVNNNDWINLECLECVQVLLSWPFQWRLACALQGHGVRLNFFLFFKQTLAFININTICGILFCPSSCRLLGSVIFLMYKMMIKQHLACFRPAFCRGDHTLKVSMEMFQENRQRLCQRLRDNSKVPKGAIVILQGGTEETRYCSDHEPLFRQVCYSRSIKGTS